MKGRIVLKQAWFAEWRMGDGRLGKGVRWRQENRRLVSSQPARQNVPEGLRLVPAQVEAEALGAGTEEQVAVLCYLQTEGAAASLGSACRALCQEPPEALAARVDFCEVGDHAD